MGGIKSWTLVGLRLAQYEGGWDKVVDSGRLAQYGGGWDEVIGLYSRLAYYGGVWTCLGLAHYEGGARGVILIAIILVSHTVCCAFCCMG